MAIQIFRRKSESRETILCLFDGTRRHCALATVKAEHGLSARAAFFQKGVEEDDILKDAGENDPLQGSNASLRYKQTKY